MSSKSNALSNITIEGFCAKDFEPVKKIFCENFETGDEENAQLCIYVGQECVLDLYGSSNSDPKYGPDLLHVIFSSSKCIESIVVGLIVDQGLLNYEEKVSSYWPEFAQHGKKNVKLEEVLRHESGLAKFKDHVHKNEDLLRENIKSNSIGKVIEKCVPEFPKSSLDSKEIKREYHAATRGFILNEIVRRVDPMQRTIGEIIEEDIRVKGIALGLKDNQFSQCANLSAPSLEWGINYLENNIDKHAEYRTKLARLKYAMNAKTLPEPSFPGLPKFDPSMIHPYFERKEIRKGEFPSGNVHASARGIAKLASAMANEGKMLDGRRLISVETWQKMHEDPSLSFDAGLGGRTCFTQGGVNHYCELDDVPNSEVVLMPPERIGYYGWDGLGGSVMQWNPDLKIGFGYVPTKLHWYNAVSRIGTRLQQAAIECTKNYVSRKID